MFYIKEYLTEHDKKYIIAENLWTTWRPMPSRWVINKENGNWLLDTFWGSEEDRNGKEYLFCFNKIIYEITAEIFEIKSQEVKLNYIWKLRGLQGEYIHLGEFFFKELKLALIASHQELKHLYASEVYILRIGNSTT